MAAPQCMSNDGNRATFVGTFLETGDGVTLCEQCLPDFMGAVMAQMLGIDPEEFSAAIENLQAGAEAMEAGDPAEVAYPPHTATAGAPTDEPPAPAPADADPQAERDPTSAVGETGESDAGAKPTANSTAASSEESPPTGDIEAEAGAQ